MKKIIMLVSVVGTTLLFSAPLAAEKATGKIEDLDREAMEITRSFVNKLKPQLKSALTEGGPVHAINVCSKTAPEIARDLSMETGWTVRRVSLRARNSELALPDAWEQKTLKEMELKAKNNPDDPLVVSEVTENQYRFAKGQKVEQVCLLCHGNYISPDIKDALEETYPGDKAAGYSMGDVRGMISLVKPLDVGTGR